jgi:flagellar biosynthesis/type III secretory pathway protein FliH
MKENHIFSIAVSVIIGLFFFSFLSCNSEENLREKYNRGYSDGNKAGYGRGFDAGKTEGHNEGFESGKRTGYNNGYNSAKNEYQNRIAVMEGSHRTQVTTMENNHKTELTASYNRGFQAGEVSMENKILALVDLNTQQKIRRNRRNEPLFRLR